MANSTEETEKELELQKRQAWAWCHLVTVLMLDCGLSDTEPGENMLEQVKNFVKRNIKREHELGE